MLKTCKFSFILFAVAALISCRTPQMVTISKLEGSKILKLDQTGIEMEVSLRIKNPNQVGFNIYKTSDLNAKVNGMDLGRMKIKKKIRIRANSDDVHTFTLSSDFSKMSLTDLPKLLTLGKSKSATINIKGKLKVGKFFYKKTFDVDRTEKVSM